MGVTSHLVVLSGHAKNWQDTTSIVLSGSHRLTGGLAWMNTHVALNEKHGAWKLATSSYKEQSLTKFNENWYFWPRIRTGLFIAALVLSKLQFYEDLTYCKATVKTKWSKFCLLLTSPVGCTLKFALKVAAKGNSLANELNFIDVKHRTLVVLVLSLFQISVAFSIPLIHQMHKEEVVNRFSTFQALTDSKKSYSGRWPIRIHLVWQPFSASWMWKYAVSESSWIESNIWWSFRLLHLLMLAINKFTPNSATGPICTTVVSRRL